MRTLLALVIATGLSAAEPPPVVLMPIAPEFNTTEFYPMWHGLREAGYQVVVAAPQAGAVAAGKLPYPDAVALAPEQAAAFALVLAGGKAPAALEEVPLAVDLVRGFMAADKPVSAICHGPRLLAKAGALAGRVTTAWHEVADETPERWTAGAYGSYVDQAVVRDRRLVTSRYPEDATAWLRATLELFAACGALPVETRQRRILVVNPVCPPQVHNAIVRTLPALLPGVTVVREWQLAETAKAGVSWDAIVLLDGAKSPALAGDAALASLLTGRTLLAQPESATATGRTDAEALPTATDVASAQTLLHAICERLRRIETRPLAQPPAGRSAVLALQPGFDDRVAAAMQADLEANGFTVTAMAMATGWQRGLGGLPVEATATYALPAPGAGAVVVAPGGFAPGEPDPARTAWLLAAWKAGAVLVVAGSDVLAVGRDPACKGMRVAGCEQLRWSYGGDGAKHADERALLSAERLLTIRDAACLGDGLRLLRPLVTR
jgi:protease I